MHKSARVPVITAEDIIDLHESRIVIEGDAVRRLAAGGVMPPDAEEAAAAVLRHAKAGNADKMAAADVAFHRALVEAAGVQRLARMHTMVMGEAHLCMVQVQLHNPKDAATSFKEHQGVLESIKAGHADEASDRIRAHLERTRDELLKAIG
jgi:DNA-binding GntR family transcriptional regulator